MEDFYMPAKKDLTGKRFGRLLVEYDTGKKNSYNRILWHCKCDCGNELDISSASLNRSKPTQSCGCLQKEKTREANQSKDLTGKVYGYLTVLRRIPNSALWECQCKCGNKVIVNTNHLNTGHTKSCGCYQKERTSEASTINLVGKRFGLLTVLKLDTQKSIPKIKYWICQCDCGNIVSVRGTNLNSGDTQSCGCMKMSHGELKIQQILKEYNIPFIREKSFDSCINPKTNKKLRFDFFVDNKYLIEYDGIQHSVDTPMKNWGESIDDVQYRDNIKTQWCKDNNIPLIRIPYTKYKDLTIDDLLLQEPC